MVFLKEYPNTTNLHGVRSRHFTHAVKALFGPKSNNVVVLDSSLKFDSNETKVAHGKDECFDQMTPIRHLSSKEMKAVSYTLVVVDE